MGDGWTLERFILKCDNHYLSKNLATLAALSEPDYNSFIQQLKKSVLHERSFGEITKVAARKKWGLINEISPDNEYFDQECNWDTLSSTAGEEWMYDIPKKDSAVYVQLCRILDALKVCLKERGINLELIAA